MIKFQNLILVFQHVLNIGKDPDRQQKREVGSESVSTRFGSTTAIFNGSLCKVLLSKNINLVNSVFIAVADSNIFGPVVYCLKFLCDSPKEDIFVHLNTQNVRSLAQNFAMHHPWTC